MKKKNILNLIKYYSEKNDFGFRNESYEIAHYFDRMGDHELSEYIVALLSDTNTFLPQINESNGGFFKKLEITNEPLPLPDAIKESIIGIINAVGHNAGVNKFLFEGPPGTGKTESVKQIARILNRELFIVEFDALIDSKLGQTSKNLSLLFEEIKKLPNPEKIIILFDEIDAIAIDRINSNDLREMGRATSAVLKGLDGLNDKVILIATTNLFNSFDKALTRRFDSVINFNQYTKEDLIDIGEIILNNLLNKFKLAGKNMRLFKKILNLLNQVPYPGELKNLIKSSLAFSEPSNEFDYLKRLYRTITRNLKVNTLKEIQEKGFTVRELEILTGISKSQISRELKDWKEIR
ncbi:MAG: AAA family ATPase [Fusobacteriaceae bacterium]